MNTIIKEGRISTIDYIVMFLMLICCGFPVGDKIPGKSFLIIAIGLVYLINNRIKVKNAFRPLLFMLFMFVVVFLAHYLRFGIKDNVLLQQINLSIAGFFVCYKLKGNFKYAYFNIIYVLSFISIICFLTSVLIGYTPNIDFLYKGTVYKGILFWNTRVVDRNCGPFWEPGAFSGYILMAFVFYFNNLKELWKSQPWKVTILIIALLTTFSTQGYVGSFLILMSKMAVSMKVKKAISITLAGFLMLFISFIIYESTPFLKEKIDDQVSISENWDSDRSLQTANRFTTTFVDLDIISKNPIFGATNDPGIRYQDFAYIILYEVDRKGLYGAGSGMTMYAAANGLLLLFLWIYLTYQSLVIYYADKKSALLIILCLLAIGQGEVYINYILYLSLPYLFLTAPNITSPITRRIKNDYYGNLSPQ